MLQAPKTEQMPQANIIGPQVRKARVAAGLTQDLLAARCGALGWDISRATLAKIEARVRCVTDAELWMLAEAVGCQLESLYPPKRALIREAVKSRED